MDSMQRNKVEEVYSRVTTLLEDQDARELWSRLKSELTRMDGGPDACRAYLEDESARMKDQIRRALGAIE